jgi:hypothetical protein
MIYEWRVKMKRLVFCAFLTLTACGGGGGDDDDDFSINKKKIEDVAGIWDYSQNLGNNERDEAYLVIDNNGYLSYYDYAGDTFDDWGNCYWIEKKYAQISHLRANRYHIKYLKGDNSSGEIELTSMRSTLRVVEGDPNDRDQDGNVTETRTLNLPKSTKTLQDLTPECVDSRADARALIPAKAEVSIPFL